MLKIKYNKNEMEEVIVDDFYSHELRIGKIKSLGAGSVELAYIHETDTAKNNASLLAMILILQNIQSKRDVLKVRVSFDYMPFSRMDKEDSQYEETLKPFLKILEPMVDNIKTYSVHSLPMFEAIFGKRHVDYYGDALGEAKSDQFKMEVDKFPIYYGEKMVFVGVDDGAVERYNLELRFLTSFKKTRVDGKIVEQVLENSEALKIHSPEVIGLVDDICSKGTTFVNAGKKIKEILPDVKLFLYVEFLEHEAHKAGLTKEVFKMFDKVYYKKEI